MDFEKICMMFTMQEPYYGILLSAMERVPAPHLTPTMGVGRTGNVFRLVYNPDFVNRLDIDVALEILKHECLHLALCHFSLWDETKDPNIHATQNIALDMEVNGYLKAEILKRNTDPVLASKYGWENFLGGREYFKRLTKLREDSMPRKKRSVLEGLSRIEKKCFLLNRRKKLAIQQIAAKLNISEQEVKTHIRKARKHVKSKLRANGI